MKKEHEARFSLRIPQEVLDSLKPIAEAEERSLNWEIVHAIREYVARKRKEQTKRATENF